MGCMLRAGGGMKKEKKKKTKQNNEIKKGKGCLRSERQNKSKTLLSEDQVNCY